MKLSELKKLKVAELRVRLEELGLDSQGLKAELVQRLWSVLEAEQSGETKKEEVKLTSDTLADLTPPSPDGAHAAVRSKANRSRKVTNTGTQTESGPDLSGEPPKAAKPRHEDSPGEDTEHPLDISRGRAFYDFKEEVKYKRAKSPLSWSKWKAQKESDENKLRLDSYACHLHFKINPEGSGGHPRYWDWYPLIWSGCRLTHGVRQGKVSFEVRLNSKLTVQLQDQRVEESYGLRIGWSVTDSSLLLGEDELSFAYDANGEKVSGGKKEKFGKAFSEGVIIGCYASFSTDGAVELSFHKNGCSMGTAFYLKTSILQGRALFPHILCKSCAVQLNLDPTNPTWYPGPAGFTPLAALSINQMVRSTPAPTFREQCEVVMMVGLPGSGKTFWAQSLMEQHPDKHYQLLGTEEVLKCMMSEAKKETKLQQASHCLTEMIKEAAVTPGNYILDQYNILVSARHYKMQLFAGFKRRVVVIFPSVDEWKKRLLQRQINDGEHIPETSLLKLEVSCSLPEQTPDVLHELQYVELPQHEAQNILKEYKTNAHRLLPPKLKEEKKQRRFKKRPHNHCTQPQGYTGYYKVWTLQPTYSCLPFQNQCYYHNRSNAHW